MAIFIELNLPRTFEWRYEVGYRVRGATLEAFTLGREVETTPRVIWRADQDRNASTPDAPESR